MAKSCAAASFRSVSTIQDACFVFANIGRRSAQQIVTKYDCTPLYLSGGRRIFLCRKTISKPLRPPKGGGYEIASNRPLVLGRHNTRYSWQVIRERERRPPKGGRYDGNGNSVDRDGNCLWERARVYCRATGKANGNSRLHLRSSAASQTMLPIFQREGV